MPNWPPAVILAAYHDTIRRTIREMLRDAGVKDLEICASCRDAYTALGGSLEQIKFLILDGALSDALEIAKEISADFGDRGKMILIFSGPTQRDIETAIEAGVSEIVTYPFSQATVEKKLRKLAGVPDPQIKTCPQKREFPRSDIPATLVVPSLSRHPIIPENISGGGFKLVTHTLLKLGTIIPCSLQINGESFPDLRARVARVEEQATIPLSWVIGLALEIARSQQKRLASFIEKARRKKTQPDLMEEMLIT